MKRFYLSMAAFCLLSLSALGCPVDGGAGTSPPAQENEAPPGNVGPPDSPEPETPAGPPEGKDPPPSPGNAEPPDSPEPETPVDPPKGKDPPPSPGNAEPPASPESETQPNSPGNDDLVVSPEKEKPSPEGDPPFNNPGQPGNPDEDAGEDRSPWLVLNELRTEALTAQSSPAHTRRVEFVELRTLSAGNLGGLRMFIYRSGSSNPIVFEFPDVEVNAGEFVVLHLRTLVENQFVDAYPAAHNFWVPGTASILNQNSAIYVLDRDYAVLSAVMVSSGTVPPWWARVAAFLFEHRAWKSPSGGVGTAEDAVNTAGRGTGVTWSVSRDETATGTDTAADWYISSRATPGRPNE